MLYEFKKGDKVIWPELTEEQVKGMCLMLASNHVPVGKTEGGDVKGVMRESHDNNQAK